MTRITRHEDLPDADVAAVSALADKAAAADGSHPLNEAAQLALAGQGSAEVVHWLASSDESAAELIGYAQLDTRDRSVQLVVDPDHRHHGIGRALAERIISADHPISWWAFGDLPGAQALASALGLEVIRGLLIMRLDLATSPLQTPTPLPAGFVLDHYRPDDLDDLVAVNAAAFAQHPEQGTPGRRRLRGPEHESWWQPEAPILAGGAGGRIRQTRRLPLDEAHDATRARCTSSESPRSGGRGLGTVLLEAGLIRLPTAARSASILYVEAGERAGARAVPQDGLTVVHTDTLFEPRGNILTSARLVMPRVRAIDVAIRVKEATVTVATGEPYLPDGSLSSTASSVGSHSTSASSIWPRTPSAFRCWSAPTSWRSSRSNLDEFFMVPGGRTEAAHRRRRGRARTGGHHAERSARHDSSSTAGR